MPAGPPALDPVEVGGPVLFRRHGGQRHVVHVQARPAPGSPHGTRCRAAGRVPLPDRTGPTPPDQPVRIVVSPASAALDPYQTQQFRAYGRSAAGDSVPVSVSYTATGGAITVSGLYTAGLVPGNWRVIAIQSGGFFGGNAGGSGRGPAPRAVH